MTLPRVNVRVAFLLGSVLVHVALIMSLTLIPIRRPVPFDLAPEVRPAGTRVFLPPSLLRDRISIGRPSPERAREIAPRRDDDLTRPVGPPPQASAPELEPAPESGSPARSAAADNPTGPDRVASAPDKESALGVTEGPRPTPTEPPSLARTLRSLDDRLAKEGARALAPVVANSTGPLAFDPEGADFTVWVNHWKNETYRNWIIPASVQFGVGGVVELAFTVDRAGKLVSLVLLSGSGFAALDRAAANALLGGRNLPLPADYPNPEITFRVRFHYGARAARS